VLIEDARGPRRVIARIRRNLYWGRTHGWADLVEEHDLNPLVRIPRVVRNGRWQRRSHAVTVPPQALENQVRRDQVTP
jgi:hypothetical protein